MTGPRVDPSEAEGAPTRRVGVVRSLLELWRSQRPALLILVTVPLVLTALEYWGMPWHYTRYHERVVRYGPAGREYNAINPARNPPFVEYIGDIDIPGPEPVRRYIWWSAACLLLMVVVPMLVGFFGARASPRKLGLKLKGTGRDGLTYLGLYVLFLPVVWFVSMRPDFQATYPFYKPAGGKLGMDFLVFEVAYFLQFLGIEFFFRGFMVLGLKPHLGWASVLVMLAPYCMIHYYKPMPEALGAIGAGLILGALAWRTGTIVYGWFLHYGVALSMDLLALHQGGDVTG